MKQYLQFRSYIFIFQLNFPSILLCYDFSEICHNLLYSHVVLYTIQSHRTHFHTYSKVESQFISFSLLLELFATYMLSFWYLVLLSHSGRCSLFEGQSPLSFVNMPPLPIFIYTSHFVNFIKCITFWEILLLQVLFCVPPLNVK